MKCFYSTAVLGIVVFLVSGLAQFASAQGGVSSASFSMARAGLPTDPEAVLIEEFINYHRHDILAGMGEAVAVDLRWGAPACGPRQPLAVLQVGLAASRFRIASERVPPLNLAIVIDESGSMQGKRIDYVKKALLAFLGKLRSGDRVSIIGFSDNARVVLASHSPPDADSIRSAVTNIVSEGSTNLHAGLMAGYQAVAAHFDAKKTNRVILLTDGEANRGVTDSQQIVKDSLAFNNRDIDLSTIGVGRSFNHRLMRLLTDAGRGLLHFVAEDADIEKTFVDELESLLSPVARRVSVEIEYPPELELVGIRGYTPRHADHRTTIRLHDLNHGATQVILAKFRAPAQRDAGELVATVRLRYHDVASGKQVVDERHVAVTYQPDLPADAPLLVDDSVRRNETIAEMAQGIKDLAEEVAATNDPKAAATKLENPLRLAQQRYPGLKDPNVRRMHEMLTKYGDLLDKEAARKEEFDRERAEKLPK